MGRPGVQIIIPFYNAEEYLEKCLDSVLYQTFSDWQAIIINDGSTDGSANIAKRYAEKDDRFIYSELDKNSGAAAARNAGLEMLDSEYTAFLDSDDVWDSEMLASLYEKAKKFSCDVVQCRYMYVFPGGRTSVPRGAFKKDVLLRGRELRSVYRKMMTGIYMNHVCIKLIRTELLKGLCFDTSLETCEDLKFCIDIFKKVKTYYFTDKILYHYVRRENSLTGSGLSFGQKLKANRRVSESLKEALPLWGIDNVFYRTLSTARPYTIAISKIIRMAEEKLFGRCGD